jgi:hypothetical protein
LEGDVFLRRSVLLEGTTPGLRVTKISGGTGVEVWAFTYTGEVGDVFRDVAFDHAHNELVIVGEANRSEVTRSDFLLIRLTQGSGDLLWRKDIDGDRPGGDDTATAVVVNSIGDAFVTGCFQRPDPGGRDLAVVRVDQEGNELWRFLFDGTYVSHADQDCGYQIVPGPDQEPVVRGSINNTGLEDPVIVKLRSVDGSDFLDSDADGIVDDLDNCPNMTNADQIDTDENGLGDACQCGDVNGDGFTAITDALLIARGRVPSGSEEERLGDVNDDGVCNITDALIIARGQQGSAHEDQHCPAYHGPDGP